MVFRLEDYIAERSPAEAEYHIAGHRYRVRVWTIETWDRLDRSARPPTAQRLAGIGWIDIIPGDRP